MENDIVADEDGRVVNLNSDSQMSFKQVQSIYHEITGKTEKLSKSLFSSYEITYENISQLNHKITQLYDQYDVVAKNCTVLVNHIDDCSERFSSFERFQIYDRSGVSACESISLQYNFLILLPKTSKPQPYTITIDLSSSAAVHEKIENDGAIPSSFLRFFSSNSGHVQIEYIDYTVARNFKTAIDQWVAGLKEVKTPKLIKFCQKYSQHFAAMVRLSSVLFLSAYIYFSTLSKKNIANEELLSIGILAFSGVYLMSLLSFKVGEITGAYIERYRGAAGLLLNRGDELTIQRCKASNRNTLLKFAVTIVIGISINLVSAVIVSKLGIG